VVGVGLEGGQLDVGLAELGRRALEAGLVLVRLPVPLRMTGLPLGDRAAAEEPADGEAGQQRRNGKDEGKRLHGSSDKNEARTYRSAAGRTSQHDDKLTILPQQLAVASARCGTTLPMPWL